MCVAAAAAGVGWRVVGTDLGVNVYSDGRRTDRRIARGRLTEAGAGWIVGSGEVRCLASAFSRIEDAEDSRHVSRTLREAAEAAADDVPDPSMLWDATNVIAASSGGVSRYDTQGGADHYAAGGFLLLTPPDCEDGPELADAFEFDPYDVESGVSAVLHTLSEVAVASDVTANDVSIGLLVRRGGRWKRGRMDETVGE